MADQDSPSIVIIGVGATGRGHLGEVAARDGFEVTFIDRDERLVSILQQSGSYTVGLAGEQVREVAVAGFRALHTSESDACTRAIADADILATAVLPTNLASTVRTIAAGLDLRRRLGITKPLNVIASENMEHSSSTLRDYLRAGAPDLDWGWVERHVGFPDAMIARAVPIPKQDPLRLLAEADQEWSVDATAVKEPMPRMSGMTLCPNQEAALERKLYIKNTGHMTIGVFGHLRGHTLMHEAARDSFVLAAAGAATQESSCAVVAKHGLDAADTERYRTAFLQQMTSPFLPDEIERVVREPLRKLGPGERLVGPARVVVEQGGEPVALARVIAATMLVRNPADPEAVRLAEMVNAGGAGAVLHAACGLTPDHPLWHTVLAAVADIEPSFRV